MKIGDKITCKKPETNAFGKPLFIKDYTYEIVEGDIEAYTYVTNEPFKTMNIANVYTALIQSELDEYFYTPQESRKLKLKQLNEKKLQKN